MAQIRGARLWNLDQRVAARLRKSNFSSVTQVTCASPKTETANFMFDWRAHACSGARERQIAASATTLGTSMVPMAQLALRSGKSGCCFQGDRATLTDPVEEKGLPAWQTAHLRAPVHSNVDSSHW